MRLRRAKSICLVHASILPPCEKLGMCENLKHQFMVVHEMKTTHCTDSKAQCSLSKHCANDLNSSRTENGCVLLLKSVILHRKNLRALVIVSCRNREGTYISSRIWFPGVVIIVVTILIASFWPLSITAKTKLVIRPFELNFANEDHCAHDGGAVNQWILNSMLARGT